MLISVVIPTRGRPELLLRAVKSALAQTYQNIEVIAVIDGPDPRSSEVLSSVCDSRLRRAELSENGGANRARNTGAAMAKGKWIAFLDDDDKWLPTKLEQQAALLAESNFDESLVVSCRFLVRSPNGDAVWPRRLPVDGESVGDYMFNRKSLFDGEAALNTSTLLLSKKMVDDVQFSPSAKKHQEIDFLLRATDPHQLRIRFVEEPLAIWYVDGNRAAITNTRNWVRSLEWIRSHRSRMSRRAYSGFLLINLAAEAAGQRAWSAFLSILKEAFVFGEPTLRQLCRFFLMWFVPQSARRLVRSAIRDQRDLSQKLDLENAPS
jgi:glycosyltransferase involved in cell wall biosynthesis